MRPLLAVAALIAAAPALAQTAPTPTSAPNPCTGEARRAFDFWVGQWDVRPYAGGAVIAHSRIENLYNGCAIRENWMPLKGGGGGSLNSYDPKSGQWLQTWVDSSGSRADFKGGIRDGAMVLTGFWAGSGPKGEDGLVRMTYSREPEGAVRQKGDFSGDEGKTWVTTFDLLYLPAKE